MGWTAPQDDGGSPITHYVVQELRTGKWITCRTNECDFGGLENAKAYTFKVGAVNKIGQGEWSSVSKSAFADTAPGRVDNIRMQARGDHTITVAWNPPTTQTSKVLSYTVTWQGAQPQTVPGDQTSLVVGNLDNNTQYSFTVKALNRVNYSPPRTSEPFQPMGTPAPPGTPDRRGPRVRGGSDVGARHLAGHAARGTGPDALHRHLRDPSGTPDRPGLLPRPGHDLRALGHRLRRHRLLLHRQGAQPRQHVRAQPARDVPGGGQARELGCLVGRPDGCGPAGPGLGDGPGLAGRASRSRRILVGGQVVWAEPGRRRAAISEVVPHVRATSAPVQVQLRMCNEFAAARWLHQLRRQDRAELWTAAQRAPLQQTAVGRGPSRSPGSSRAPATATPR